MFGKKIHHYKVHDGSTMYYECYGKGEPLFLLHGNNGSTFYFHRQIHFLKKYFKVYAIDSRGRGQSKDNSNHINFDLMAEDLFEIIRHEKLTKINLLGFSDGANLALIFSQKYPQMIQSLILNAANGSFNDLTNVSKRKFKLINQFLEISEKYNQTLKKYHHYFHLVFENLHLNYKKLSTFKFPVLILVGQYDIVKKEFSEKLARTFPNSKLIIEPSVGHTFALERPNIYNQYILNFLNKKITD